MKVTLNNLNDVFKSEKCGIETMELKGYKLIENLFVDSSGFGAPDEPALQLPAFMAKLESKVKQYGAVHTSLTDVGQFQVYVGVFVKGQKLKAMSQRLAKNVLRIDDLDQSMTIRLYDTNIYKKYEDGTIELNTGGFNTHTTRRWINKFLIPKGLRLFQKDFSLFVEDSNTKKIIPFTDGIKIKGGLK